MKALLHALWLALAWGSVHTTLSKSDARKAASKTLLEKVRVVGDWLKRWHATPSSCLLGSCARAASWYRPVLWLGGVRGSRLGRLL